MQQEYTNAQEGAIDISKILESSIRCMANYWIQMLMIAVIGVLGTVSFFNLRYQPTFTAKVTYAVVKTDFASVDSDIAARLSTSVAEINSLKEFQNELFEGIKPETINKNYTVTSTFTEETTLFTVYINANHYANANLILDRFQKIYPKWAEKTVGAVDLQVVGANYCAPTIGGGYSIRSSVLKGLLVAFVLCAIFIYLYSQLVTTVQSENDMKNIGVSNCIVAIPDVIKKKRNKGNMQLLISKSKVDWGFKQSILAAQSRIEKQMAKEGKQVIVVTSTVPQEGKSSITTNLALAFAGSGKKVLLIDGDFRKPSVSDVLGIEEAKGITDCFVDVVHPKIFMRKSGSMYFLSAGTYKGAVSGILNHRIMNLLMKKWRERFDYIFIDTAPTMYTDASIFAQYADAVLYVVRYDHCDVKAIKKGVEPFIRNNQLIGYILNRNPGGFSTYGKYGRYGRYGKYGRYGRNGYNYSSSYTSVDETISDNANKKQAMNTEDSL